MDKWLYTGLHDLVRKWYDPPPSNKHLQNVTVITWNTQKNTEKYNEVDVWSTEIMSGRHVG